ncbi:MAG: riboflavin biosynthesis protein RibF [Actinomycetota bacterium]|jgi:riboflavin kinase/FMN adenylyltransferase
MLQISNSTELPAELGATAVAIGKFDGLHLGHQQLLHELVEYCQDAGLVPAAITFDRHPKALLDPDNCPRPLIGPMQKASLVEATGVEVLLTLPFTQELANLSPRAFIEQVIAPLTAQMIFVGQGFRFGSHGSGGIDDLRDLGPEFGFRVREVANVEVAGRKISSTDLREILDAGKVEVANLLLGRNHQVTGLVEHGRKLGRTLGFPTANISRSAEGYLPGDGVYAGYLYAEGIRYPAAHSVGTNDTVGEVPRVLESHVIGRTDLDLYDLEVTCEFVAQVRGWTKFASLEGLIAQIAVDVEKSKEFLGE